MRFLANENFPLDAVQSLRAHGHDVVWVRMDSPGSLDEQVLERANREKRVLLTFDKDFGELAFHARLNSECGVVLFRISAPSSWEMANFIVTAIQSREDWAGNFAVIEEQRIRMRPLK